MGRLYRGIQDASLHQYTFLGDAAAMTDNQVFHDTDGTAIKVLAEAAVAGDQTEPKIDHLPPLDLRVPPMTAGCSRRRIRGGSWALPGSGGGLSRPEGIQRPARQRLPANCGGTLGQGQGFEHLS